MKDLAQHITEIDTTDQAPTDTVHNCKICHYFSSTVTHEENHMNTNHQPEPYYELSYSPNNSQPPSPIAQVDGVDDAPGILPMCTGISSNPAKGAPNILLNNYVLNKSKQVSGLLKHTKLSDFDFVTNDSGRNVTIQCSLGFYEAVAKPSFTTISAGFREIALGIIIECTEARVSYDQDSSISGFFLRFLLCGAGVLPDPAPLTVHLHHTQAKVQLQGGASMPDNNPAANWFVEHLLKERFKSEAKNKKFAIENINNRVSTFISSNIKLTPASASCAHCKSKFGNNSRPVRCFKCSQYKHKTKCKGLCPSSSSSRPSMTSSSVPPSSRVPKSVLPSWSLLDNSKTSSLLTTVPPSQQTDNLLPPLFSPPSAPPRTKRIRDSGHTANITSAPVFDDIAPAPDDPRTHQTAAIVTLPSSIQPMPSSVSTSSGAPPAWSVESPGISFAAAQPNTTQGAATTASSSSSRPLFTFSAPRLSPITLTPTSIPATVTASSAPTFTPARDTSLLNVNAQPFALSQDGTRKRKSKPAETTTTPEQLEIKFLKIELNAVRTQALELETNNVDLKRKVKIMEDLIKTYEEKLTVKAYDGLQSSTPPPPHNIPPQSSHTSTTPVPGRQHDHCSTSPPTPQSRACSAALHTQGSHSPCSWTRCCNCCPHGQVPVCSVVFSPTLATSPSAPSASPESGSDSTGLSDSSTSSEIKALS